MQSATLLVSLWALSLRTSMSIGEGVGVFDVSQASGMKSISH